MTLLISGLVAGGTHLIAVVACGDVDTAANDASYILQWEYYVAGKDREV